MNRKNIFIVFVLIFTILTMLSPSSRTFAAVEWEIKKTLTIDEAPVDFALSPDGSRLFVLTDQGNIRVYSSGTELTDGIEVGRHIDQIQVGPQGDVLLLRSRQNKTIQIAQLEFIQSINIAGSPFKGSEDAPVVIAVFDDFQ